MAIARSERPDPVIETRHCLKLSAPKGRKQRVTMYPARGGVATTGQWALGVDLSQPAPRLCHLGPSPARARLEDVSRLLGHSSVRITQDIYVSPDGDLFERFYAATE